MNVKNKLTYRTFIAALIFLLAIGTSGLSYGQNSEVKATPPEVKSTFMGHWKDIHDPNHLIEIYKDGDFIIVNTYTEKKDESGNKRYTVTSGKGNKIMVDFGFGVTPLTLSDDGTKITFTGETYMKQ